MRGVMKLLAAARLVDLSEEEAAAMEDAAPGAEQDYSSLGLSAAEPQPYGEQPPPLPQADLQPVVVNDILEGQPFETIFAEAGVPPSPYPAERLLRLIDGLRAMDEATRRTAVQAMDAADDSWTIEDPVLDAQRKMQALQSYSDALVQQVDSTEQQSAAEIAALQAAEENAVAEIRKQIAGLEKLLEREMQKTAATIATRQAEVSSARAAAQREMARVEAEVARLRDIAVQFANTPTHSAPSAHSQGAH